MKKKFTIILALLLILTMTACGAASYDTAKGTNEMAPAAPIPAPAEAPMEAGAWAEEIAFEEAVEAEYDAEASGTDNTANYAATLKIIKTGDLTIESETFEATDAYIRQAVDARGGLLQEHTVSGTPGCRWSYYVVRVPSAEFDNFFYEVAGACTVVSQSISSEDVTERYTDLETQLTTNRKKYERLLVLMDEATTLTDLYSIESEITQVEYEIDRITGILNGLDSKIAFSTIYINVQETSAATAIPDDPTFGAALVAAFRNGTRSIAYDFEDLIISLAYNWLGTIIFLVIVVLAILFGRRLLKKRNAKKAAAKSPTEPQEPTEP